MRETQCLRRSLLQEGKHVVITNIEVRIENISVAINSGKHSRNINNLTSPFSQSLTFAPLSLR